jgi:putative ABC transport system permease protein
MSTLSPVSLPSLVLAGLLVVALAGYCWPLHRGSSQGLLIGMARACLQLSLIGLVIRAVFAHVALGWVALVSLIMIVAAAREIVARQHYRGRYWASFRTGFVSMGLGSVLLTLLALLVMIRHQPWYHPQFSIPFLGMMLGNSMTAIALTINRIIDAAHQQRQVIVTRLALGQSRAEVGHTLRVDGLRQGLIPIINMMAASGLVSLPGMMTGQILGGVDPMVAVGYQLLIIFLIATSAGVGMLLATRFTLAQLFDSRERLRLDGYQLKA